MKQKHRTIKRTTSVIVTICLFMVTITIGQDSTSNYSKEISFKTENDAYLLNLNDAYYTNGFFLNYGWAKQKANHKKMQSVELSQMIFTPLNRTATLPVDMDRTYCGYLSLKYMQTRFQAKHIIQFGGNIGIVGKASGGEWMQNWYHDLIGFAKFKGWQYQIANAVGVDLNLSYATNIYNKGVLKLAPVLQANLGTLHTNAKVGMYTVFGVFEKNENSALWNARIDGKTTTRNRHNELFLYWYPQLITQGYNATLQGGRGVKNSQQLTQDIAPTMFQQAWGLCYAEARWTMRLELVYQSKETPAQTKAQRYGVIQLCYRIH
jgi:lipid A 3-O-deacylase